MRIQVAFQLLICAGCHVAMRSDRLCIISSLFIFAGELISGQFINKNPKKYQLFECKQEEKSSCTCSVYLVSPPDAQRTPEPDFSWSSY